MRNVLVVAVLLLAGCAAEADRAPVIGEAYVGPATLPLRQEIALKSDVVATVKHGDRLQILQRRRRFLKVRTERGLEGWIDERLLLSPDEIAELRQFSDQSKSMPSQGVASTYDTLNIHTEPNRRSPSFLQVKEGEKLEVIGHRVTPRVTPPRKPIIVRNPNAPKRPAKKPRESVRIPPPPMPAPPKLPENWLELSKFSSALPEPPKVEPEPVPMDDWTLVRTSTGQSGWVLTGRIYLAIPDEVAQYAEGRRITSYFSLGQVRDGDQIKHHWLWTTISRGLQTYDFDSFRVFIWNLRRHRYETAYIERNRTGYFPVLTHPVAFSGATYPGFSVCLEKDGVRYRRSYAFLTNIVRFAGEVPCEQPGEGDSEAELSSGEKGDPSPGRSLYGRLKDRAEQWRKRLFGRLEPRD